MILDPFITLEKCTLGSWPTSTFLVTDDVVADADNFIHLKAGFKEVDGCVF